MIPPAVSHIYFFKQALDSSTPIFTMWKPTIIVQVIQCVGITTTCVPFWWRFLKSLESGQMGAGDIFGALSRSNNTRSGGASHHQAFELQGTGKFGRTWNASVALQTSQEALVNPSSVGTRN